MSERDIVTVPEGEGEAGELPTRLGHFEIVGRLGAGGMGLVFEGRDALLGRRVALKLIHPSRAGGHIAPARLLREAQALARLSHPNVVTVFEVGMAGDDPFIAMELVEGVTLLEWMRRPRDWRAVLDMFLAVGHGLAAVHALGLVHRDFKPSNVLVDGRGVPKLGDFGLVAASDDLAHAPPAPPTAAEGDGELTEPGAVMGTPAYMAPEQRLGEAVDARADQYSFAKSLREALRAPMPAALEPILARALATAPGDRFAAMAPLLDELARVRRGHRRRWLAAGGSVAVVAAVAAAWGVGRARSSEDPCARPTDRVDAVWSAARRKGLEVHLAVIDPAFGAQRFAAASSVIDRGAARWMDLHVEACRVSHDGRQSDALLDRRMTCLDRALFEIGETIGVLERTADRVALDDAMRAAIALPTLDACADVAALTEMLPRPTNPLRRAEADAIARETVDIELVLRAGGPRTGVAQRARSAVARARTLGDPETLSRALASLAAIQLEEEVGADTVNTLREAITSASAAHDDRFVARLWTRLLTALVIQKRARDAETLVPAAEAAVARTAARVDLGAAFLEAKSQVAGLGGDVPRSQQLLAEAVRVLEAAGAATPDSPLAPQVLAIRMRAATMRGVAGDWPRMVAESRALIPLVDAQYGPDHPVVLRLHFNLGIALRRVRDDKAALVEFREAARVGEARLAASPGLADILLGVGSTLAQLRHNDEALPYLERALAMARATMPPNDRRLTRLYGALGATLTDVRRFAEGRALLEAQIALEDSLEPRDDVSLTNALYNLGKNGADSGHCEIAWAPLARALAIHEAAPTKDRYDIDSTNLVLGECLLLARAWPRALQLTDAILRSAASDPEMRGLARYMRGRALVGAGDLRAGMAEVRAARKELAELESTNLPEVDAWLTRHQGQRML